MYFLSTKLKAWLKLLLSFATNRFLSFGLLRLVKLRKAFARHLNVLWYSNHTNLIYDVLFIVKLLMAKILQQNKKYSGYPIIIAKKFLTLPLLEKFVQNYNVHLYITVFSLIA